MSIAKRSLLVPLAVLALGACGGGGGSSAVKPGSGGTTNTLPLSSSVARLDGGTAAGVSATISIGATLTDVTLAPTIDGTVVSPIVYSAADVSSSNATLQSYVFGRSGGNGKYYQLAIFGARSASETLQYARYGYWAQQPSVSATPDIIAAFHTGSATLAANMPTSGSATYTGVSVGQFVDDGATKQSTDFAAAISLTVNFGGSKAVTGSISNFSGISSPTGTLNAAVTGTVSGAGFSGTAVATGGATTLGSGTISGQFYGPNAEETAGSYGIKIGADQGIIGAFGARRP